MFAGGESGSARDGERFVPEHECARRQCVESEQAVSPAPRGLRLNHLCVNVRSVPRKRECNVGRNPVFLPHAGNSRRRAAQPEVQTSSQQARSNQLGAVRAGVELQPAFCRLRPDTQRKDEVW
jgi:hypothetical protein